MCGVVAIVRGERHAGTAVSLGDLTASVAHRGPDGSGMEFLTADGVALADRAEGVPWRVALGHRRLSIIDLSEAGRQPMSYRDRLWITYNGEVYNYVELRRELEGLGHSFASRSDTEVILAAYDQWGPACFARLRGMWGLVLIDGRQRRAVLSRDRLGIKPLYLRRGDGFVAAVSEIKQLSFLPGVRLAADRDAVAEYLATGYEDMARTFFAGVASVPPGTWLSVDLETLALSLPESYWHPERVPVTIRLREEAAAALAEVLTTSVKLHLRSDVPVGCALSGGLDSSAVAALVQQIKAGAGEPLHAFTVTFPGAAIDERRYAEMLVRKIGATPHFVTPTPGELLEELDRFVWIHDEPVGSLSQFAGYRLARLTREAGVPVTLNGQGGDEVLAGYWQSYFAYLGRCVRSGRIGRVLANVGCSLLPGGNPQLWSQLPPMLRRLRERRGASDAGRERIDRVLKMSDQERRVVEIREMYLPRLLKWDDRNFMAFGVEGRYPLLDHEVIATSLSIAPDLFFRAGWTRYPLRQGLSGLLPREICWRRDKLGFETPQEEWLAGRFKPAIESFLDGDSPVWQWVEPARARALARATSDGGARRDGASAVLLRCFMVDRWMRRFALQ